MCDSCGLSGRMLSLKLIQGFAGISDLGAMGELSYLHFLLQWKENWPCDANNRKGKEMVLTTVETKIARTLKRKLEDSD